MILKLSWDKIIDLLLNASKNLILIMPAIHDEWIEVIKRNENLNELDLQVCIENSERSIRSGYGDIKSIEALKQLNVTLKECEGLRVNFLCSDQQAYCLFLESRIIAGNPEGFNALEIDTESAQRIINQFFPKLTTSNEDISTPCLSEPYKEDKAEKVKKELIKNPPNSPDLKRKINTYKTHFQYAEIHFKGGGIQTKTITIPKDALPFKDAELKNRMITRFNLFTKEDTDNWNNLDEIESMISSIRKDFLHPCKYKRGRNIIDKSKKAAFLLKVEEIKKAVSEKKKGLIDDIQRAINKSEDVLTNEMTLFFQSNIPEKILEMKDDELRKRQIDKMIQEIIVGTKLPSASDLIDKMEIQTDYAEFTEEDLSDNEFLAWFKEKKLLTKETENEIASFKNAFEVKR